MNAPVSADANPRAPRVVTSAQAMKKDARSGDEALSAVADGLSRTAALLERDVERTLGPGYRRMIDAARSNVESLDVGDQAVKLVDDVQQAIHDSFVDVVWPACPRHGHHPLWYEGGAWRCAQDHAIVAQLGELALPSRPAD